MAIQDEQRLKDLLRNIETGDIPEDLPDPEDYDDMGGIKSLDRGAPSIKMASEPEDEFELELGTVIKEYFDLKEQGIIRDISIEEYIDKYLSRKKMMEDKRAMAAYGGRMNFADGPKDPTYTGNNLEDLPEGLKRDTTTYPLGQGANIKSIEELLKKPKSDAIGTSILELKKLLEKRKKEKKKLAKGGIAGVL